MVLTSLRYWAQLSQGTRQILQYLPIQRIYLSSLIQVKILFKAEILLENKHRLLLRIRLLQAADTIAISFICMQRGRSSISLS